MFLLFFHLMLAICWPRVRSFLYMVKANFTKTFIALLAIEDKFSDFYDAGCKGLTLRMSPKGLKTFYFRYTAGKGRGARTQRVKIGSFPSVSLELARQRANELATLVAQGRDPAASIREVKARQTLNTIFAEFEEEHLSKRKAGTQQRYHFGFHKNIAPTFGRCTLQELTTARIQALHTKFRKTPRAANMAVAILSSLFSWAARRGYCERGLNPCSSVERYPERRKQTFLSVTQVKTLMAAIDAMERNGLARHTEGGKGQKDILTEQTANLFRLLILTGARRGEIQSLKWAYIREAERCAYLPDSKTGFRVLPLPEPALAILRRIPRHCEYVFPAGRGETKQPYQVGVQSAWKELLAFSGIGVDKVDGRCWRIHDLRHAFASAALNSGEDIAIVSKTLGHADLRTTMRYAHVAQKSMTDAASRTAQLLTNGRNTGDGAGNRLSYRGFSAPVEFDAGQMCLTARIEGTPLILSGQSVEELRGAFKQWVDGALGGGLKLIERGKEN